MLFSIKKPPVMANSQPHRGGNIRYAAAGCEICTAKQAFFVPETTPRPLTRNPQISTLPFIVRHFKRYAVRLWFYYTLPYGKRKGQKQTKNDMFPYRMFLLANDLHIDTLASALCHGLDNGTDLFCNPALTANDLAHILRATLGSNVVSPSSSVTVTASG